MKRLTVDIIVNTSTGVHNYVNCFFFAFYSQMIEWAIFNIFTTVSEMAKISLKWLKWFSLKWLKWSTFRKFCINHVKLFHILSYE